MTSSDPLNQTEAAAAPMPLDPLTSLSIATHLAPGSFALLVGSGISRAAQILTGWEIVVDLIKRIALAEGIECDPTPEQWYQDRFGVEPNYSDILAKLADTQPERSRIIHRYLEPTDEERAQGIKEPTIAHQAIAELVARGYIRVIVTTNFDRLLERALEAQGVTPSVIASKDDITKVYPLAHNRCTVIKLHGDYVGARLRNTIAELGTYPPAMEDLLAQVFREYGLMICGWSGNWDTALVEALRNTKSPWFSTYWSSRGEPGSVATSLLDDRSGRMIRYMDADQLFRRLADTISGLEGMSRPELVSAAIARSTLKQYLVDPTKRIRLYEMVNGEALRVRRALDAWPRDAYSEPITKESVLARLTAYEQLTETLRSLMATGCYWGAPEHDLIWSGVLTRLFDLPPVGGYSGDVWSELRMYPALLALYSAGIACVANGRYDSLRTLLYEPFRNRRDLPAPEPLLDVVHPAMASFDLERVLGDYDQNRVVAMTDHLWKTASLWDGLREILPMDAQFIEAFDRFEYMLGLAIYEHTFRPGRKAWGPVGWFQYRHLGSGRAMAKRADEELATDGADWPPLRAGLFGGSIDRLLATKEGYDDQIRL